MAKRTKNRQQKKSSVPVATVRSGPMLSSIQHFLASYWKHLLLALAIVLTYQPAWNGQPLWDDDGHITKPGLRSWLGLERIWVQPGATQQYYPLTHSLFWLEHQLWGDWPIGYHLVNIWLHALSAFLLLNILQRLEVPGAWLATALWALHPVEVESVAWISELKNTLSGVFYLGAALAYLEFDHTRARRAYGVSLALFGAGLLAKTVIATLPAALLVIFWWKRGEINGKRDVAPLVPFFAAGAAAGLFTAWMEKHFIGASGSVYDYTFIERGLIAGRAVWFYLGKLIWPHPLIFIYPHWQVSQIAWWQYVYPVALVTLALGLWLVRRKARGPLAALLFFVGTLFPALGFINVYPFRFSFVADHFQYLASIGPITLAAFGITYAFRLLGEKGALLQQLACGVLLSFLAALSWNQSRMYRDSETLWRTTIAQDPESWMAYNNLGNLLAESSPDEATTDLRKALRIKPDFAEAHNNLGVALFKSGHLPEAIAEYEQALQSDPGFGPADNNLGYALLQAGRMSEAAEQFQKALRLKPDYVEVHFNMGMLLEKSGRTMEAEQEYQTAVDIAPDCAEAHNNLGNLLFKAGRSREAQEHYREALRLKPDFAEAHSNFGILLVQSGRIEEALDQYQQALKAKPDYAEARNNLGIILIKTGRIPEAIEQFETALRINPNDINARNNLARLQAYLK